MGALHEQPVVGCQKLEPKQQQQPRSVNTPATELCKINSNDCQTLASQSAEPSREGGRAAPAAVMTALAYQKQPRLSSFNSESNTPITTSPTNMKMMRKQDDKDSNATRTMPGIDLTNLEGREEKKMKRTKSPISKGLSVQLASNTNGLVVDDIANMKRQQQLQQQQYIRPTKKRFFILFMYIMLQLIKSFQWICLASITNVAAKFYNVDNMAINWTTILFMVTFLMFALPVSWLTELFGLRRSVLIGSCGVTIGLIIKVFSCHQDGFWVSMLGHLIVGLGEPFFFSSSSQLSSIWFPDAQVASATSFALIGEAIGLSLGFIIPPLAVGSDPDNMEAIQYGLWNLFLVNAVLSTLNTISIYLFFDNEPKFAPGIARFKQILKRRASQEEQQTVWQNITQQIQQLKSILRDRNFLFLLAGFGINVGSAYSIHTLLNQMIIGPELESPASNEMSPMLATSTNILTTNGTTIINDSISNINEIVSNKLNWSNKDPNLVVGNSGLILILSGLFGSIACGSLLDKFHRYKLTTASIYLLTLLSMILMSFFLSLESPLVLYIIMIPLGFAHTGYASCGFDYGVEITYPRPELLSATTLNIAAQVLGIPISLIGSYIVDLHGGQALGLFFSLLLLAGFLLTCLQGGELKRQTAVNEDETANQNYASGAPIH